MKLTLFLDVGLIKGDVPSTIYKTLSKNRFYFNQFWQKKVRKRAKIRNRYNQIPHLTQDTNGKVANSQSDITKDSPKKRS